jgi:putative ABC transport system substrate-binding protein
MRRREFINLLGGAVGWPLAVRAQQPAKLPVIGFLTGGSPRLSADAAFVQGLREAGYVERQNVMIEYRWARGAYERPPDLAAELIALRVDLIAAFAIPAARAAKTVSVKSTPAIPVVFSIGADPVAEGLVESLNRPGGNLTGVTSIASALASKRLELLRNSVIVLLSAKAECLSPCCSMRCANKLGAHPKLTLGLLLRRA